MNHVDVKKIGIIAKSEYGKWITNPRMIVFAIYLIIIRSIAILPLLERAEKMAQPYLIRSGRLNWLLGQMLFIFLAILSIIASTMAVWVL